MDKVARSPKAQAEEKKHISHHVADFLRKYRSILLGILVGVIVAVIVVAAWSGISSSTTKASTSAIEKIEDDVGTWQSEGDQAKKAELAKTLDASIDVLVAKWPHSFAAQRAHTIKARLAEDRKDWVGAEKEWLASAELLPNTYLAPVALQGAAAAAEERGSTEKATEYYKRLLDKYTGKTVGIPHAYFSLGRLYEEAKDYAAALTSYEKIVVAYPDDDWTKLAKDRILMLKSRGLAK